MMAHLMSMRFQGLFGPLLLRQIVSAAPTDDFIKVTALKIVDIVKNVRDDKAPGLGLIPNEALKLLIHFQIQKLNKHIETNHLPNPNKRIETYMRENIRTIYASV